MTTFRPICAMLALLISGALATDPPQLPGDRFQAELAKNNLDYFKKYLSACPETQIRCLWFLEDRIRVGMVMTIDLREGTVFTMRDVYAHAFQNTQTHKMSYEQTVIARGLLPNLPGSTPDVPFSEGLHISFWRENKPHTVTYSKKATPLIVQRLYDVGGDIGGFTYAALMVTAHAAPVTQAPGGAFRPPQSYLEIQYPEYEGGPLQCYTARNFASITPLIENSECKVIWTLAEPPTTATKTDIGGLFVLIPNEGQWITTDAKRFESSGKDSDARATLTSSGSTAPHITVTLHQGGRGSEWEESASYVVKKGKLVLALPAKQQDAEQDILPHDR